MIERLFEDRNDKAVMAVYCAARAVMSGSESTQKAATRYCVAPDDVATMVQELIEMEQAFNAKISMGYYKTNEEKTCKS